MVFSFVCGRLFVRQEQPSASWRKSSSDEAAAASFGDARYQDLVREMEENGGNAAFDAEPKSTTEKIGGAIKKASATVTGALTMKPKVVKAPDPLALDNMPKDLGIDLYYQAGRVAESNGNPAAAIKQYERGLEEQPNHLPTLISLARLYDRQDEFDKAEKLYRRALEAEPDNAMAHNDLGLCLARHDRADEAIASLRQAIKLEPNRKLYRNNLATVLVDMGQVDAAYTELTAVHPAAVAHYNLGYLLYHAGNKSRAQQEFTLARQADSSLVAAQQMLDQMDAETKRVDEDRDRQGSHGADQGPVPHRGRGAPAHSTGQTHSGVARGHGALAAGAAAHSRHRSQLGIGSRAATRHAADGTGAVDAGGWVRVDPGRSDQRGTAGR